VKKHNLKQFSGLFFSIFLLLLPSCSTPFNDFYEMSSIEIINHVTKGKKKAVITVGIVQNGQNSFTVYGENGRELKNKEYIYEIASITKTFTAQLFARAINEGKLSLDDTIDRFLDLPSKKYYPTIRRLLTHTSGYRKAYYHNNGSLIEATPNFEVIGSGVTEKMLLNTIGTINLENKDYPWEYSNFAFAVAGLILKKIFSENYTSMINRYLSTDLNLNNTWVNDGKSVNVSNSWAWSKENPYIPCGALVSTITDMMKYAQMQIDEQPPYVSLSHTELVKFDPPIDVTGYDYDAKTDAMGLGWMICSVYDFIHHSGNTGYSNSFIAFDKTKRIAVVVLCNMPGEQSRLIGSAIIKELQQ